MVNSCVVTPKPGFSTRDLVLARRDVLDRQGLRADRADLGAVEQHRGARDVERTMSVPRSRAPPPVLPPLSRASHCGERARSADGSLFFFAMFSTVEPSIVPRAASICLRVRTSSPPERLMLP